MFAVIVVGVMQNTLEEQFFKRAQITSNLFATSIANAVLATDIASLESFVDEVMQNEGLLYARVKDTSITLAERAKSPDFLARAFIADTNLSEVEDNVFDTFAVVKVGEDSYGQVEIGISTDLLGSTISLIQLKVIMIGVGEIIFSALVSFLLGTFLVRRLIDLQHGSEQVAEGDFGFKIPDEGQDELAQTAKAFNDMSSKVHALILELRETNGDLEQQRHVAEQARDRAVSSSQAKSNFLNIISHELRTPTQGLKGPFEELSKQFVEFNGLRQLADLKPALPEEHREALQSAMMDLEDEVVEVASGGLRAANHLLALINEILEFAQMDAGKLSINLEAVKINNIVQSAVEIVKSSVQDKDLTLHVDIPNNILVWADPFRLTQILINLLGNAVKFTNKGSITLVVQDEGAQIHFIISDTGCGIPTDKFEAIFNAFEQIDSTMSRQAGGTGLGLPLTAGLIQGHGGKIWVESTVDVGSQFHFMMPANAEIFNASNVQLGSVTSTRIET